MRGEWWSRTEERSWTGDGVTWEMVKRELRGDEGKCKYAHSDPVRCLPVSASWAGIYPNGGSIPCT